MTTASGLFWVNQRPAVTVDYEFTPTAVNRCTLLSWLSETFQFAEYFGNNWDAAWDCLSEVPWNPQQPLRLYISFAKATVIEADALEQFIQLLADATSEWQGLAVYLQAPVNP